MEKNNYKKYDFANPTLSGDTYAGQLALPYVSAAVKANDTIGKGYVRIIEGLNRKAVINSLSVAAPLAEASCTFNATDTTNTESVITLKDLKAQFQYCRGTVFPTWIGQGMDRNGNLPQSFEEFLLETAAANVGAAIENDMWAGSTAFGVGFVSNDGTFDQAGLNASRLADFTQVTMNSGALANTTAISALNTVYDSVTANHPGLLSKPGFGFYMNNKTYGLYVQQLAGLGAGVANSKEGINGLASSQSFEGMSFMGTPIYRCPGMPDDCIVAADKENLVVATNALSDITEVRLIPTYQYDGSDNINLSMRFAIAVGAGLTTEGVVGATF